MANGGLVVSVLESNLNLTLHALATEGKLDVLSRPYILASDKDNKTSTISKIPLLGDIPFLGELFRRTQIAKSKTELLIFLTPHVALQPSSLGGMSEDEMKSTRLTPRAVEPGVFGEHMRGMQRGGIPQTQPLDPATTQPVKMIRGGDATK